MPPRRHPYRIEDYGRRGLNRILQLRERLRLQQLAANDEAESSLSDADTGEVNESQASSNSHSLDVQDQLNDDLQMSGESSGPDDYDMPQGNGRAAQIEFIERDEASEHELNSYEGESSETETDNEDVISNAELEEEQVQEHYEEEDIGGNNFIDGNVNLYPNSTITLGESMFMVLTFALNHNLSGKTIGDLLQLISLHCPQPNECITSLHMFKRYFKNVNRPVMRHYYCPQCHVDLEGPSGLCYNCELAGDHSYFITVPIVPQLKTLFKREGFYAALQHRFERVKEDENNLEDIYDGELYQRHCRAGGFLSDRNSFSFCWNSDGVPVFKSSKFSIWPFFLRINELPYAERVRKDNIILAGLWFGPGKPVPNMFLLPLIPELRMLNNGIEVDLPGHQNPINVKAMILCGTCDMPAKSLFLNFMNFNGYYGCAACTQRGGRTPDNKHVYRYQVEVNLRTEEETEEFAERAAQLREPYLGVKGVSILSRIVPNSVQSTAIDPMHKYSGITMKLLLIWFNSKFSDHPASISEHARLVNRRFCDIKPPAFVQRLPRSLDHLKYFKVSELKAFLFCYAIPCLHDLLDPLVFNHFLLLVCGLFLLNQPSISPFKLRLASGLLKEFVAQFEDVYGVEHMTCNVHQLLHLGTFVKNLGPLFASSCAPFESMNGILKKYVHGTRYADLQVCTAASLYMDLAIFKERDLRQNGPVQEFCSRLCNRQKRLRLIPICGIVSAADTLKVLNPVPAHITHVLRQINVPAHNIHTCNKIYFRKRIFTAKSYTRAKKTMSNCVKFAHGGTTRIGLIEEFLRVSNCNCHHVCDCPAQCFAIVGLLESRNPFSTNVPHCVVSFVHDCRITEITVAVRVEDF